MIKSTVSLSSEIFRRQAVMAALDKALEATALAHEESTKDLMRTSVPAGKLYKRRGGFHRASARGQRPAIDTGNLLESVAAQKVPVTRQWVVAVKPNPNPRNGVSAAKYAEILQSPYGGRKIITSADSKKFEKVLQESIARELEKIA